VRKHLPLIGSAMALAGLALALTRNTLGPPEVVAVLGGSACLLAGTLGRGGRVDNVLNAANTWLFSLFVFGSLVAAFGLALPRLPERDLTSVRLNTLTELAVQFLRRLDTPVRIVAFTYERNEFQRQLERIRVERPDYITYSIHDPFTDVDVAMEMGDGQVFPDDVFVVVGDRKRRVKGVDEGVLLNAMAAVLRGGPSTVYLLQGHGEFVPLAPKDDQAKLRTFSGLVDLLQRRHPAVSPLDLVASGNVPADAACVIVLGPTEVLGPDDAAALEAYLNRGGRIFLALGLGNLERGYDLQPDLRPWARLAAPFGVELLPAAVLDVEGHERLGSAFHAVPRFMHEMNPLPVEDPSYSGLHFTQARAMRVMTALPDGAQAAVLLYSSAKSFVHEVAGLAGKGGKLQVNPGEGSAQPLLVRADREVLQEDGTLRRARMIVAGTPHPFSDASLKGPAAQIFLTSVEELVAESADDQLPIPPRTLPDQPISLSRDQLRFLAILHALFIPGVIFFGGLGLTLRRRMGE